MIIKDDDAIKRLNSPLNLINRLNNQKNGRSKNAMDLFGLNRSSSPTNDKKEIKAEENIGSDYNWSFNSNNERESNDNKVSNITAEAIPRNSNGNGHNAISNEGTTKSNNNNEQVRVDDLIDNADNKLMLSTAHNNALKLMSDSINQLATKLDNVRADRLPQVITAASKVVESIRRERLEESRSDKEKDVHYHFYVPVQKKIVDYGQVIDVEGVTLPEAGR